MREDMFSMLFVSAVRPEYRLYCDSKHKNGNQDLNQDKISEQDKFILNKRLSFCQKLKFVFCCKSDAPIEATDNRTLPDQNISA